MLSSSTRKNKPKSVSTTYKKWLRYLKKNKLFDKYMIYMDYKYGDSGTYPYPSDYKELSVLVISLLSCAYIDVGNTYIHTCALVLRVFKIYQRECTMVEFLH